MSYKQVKQCLDILKDYPDITNYINGFDGEDGFMYTTETDITKQTLQEQMNSLLDDGTHSGASWGLTMRTVQSVLNGTLSYDELLEKVKHEEEQMQNCLDIN